MRTTVIGVLLAVGLVWASLGTSADRLPTATPAGLVDTVGARGDLIAFHTPLGEQRQQLMVIDPKTRVVSLYHVESASGKIELKSVRNLSWDLQMVEFNGTSPLPQEVRAMVEPR